MFLIVWRQRVAAQMQARLVGDSPNYGEGGGALHNPAVMNSISAGATLSPLPQNLIDLWQGTGGRKPARFFSFSELGRVKDKYHPQDLQNMVSSQIRRRLFSHFCKSMQSTLYINSKWVWQISIMEGCEIRKTEHVILIFKCKFLSELGLKGRFFSSSLLSTGSIFSCSNFAENVLTINARLINIRI